MATTATVIRTGIGAIIGVIRARLLFKGVVDNTGQILVVAKAESPPHLAAQRDILLRIGNSRIDWDGPGGRLAAKKIRTIGVYARSAQALDKGYTDEQWLDQHDAFEDKILDALLDWLPVDGIGNSLATETLHVVSAQAPDKDDADVWGDSLVTYEVHYQPAGIDPNDPAC